MNHKALFGPRLHTDGTTFRLWAPAARQVELVLDKPHPMRGAAEGWYVLDMPDVGAGTRYKFRIDGELDVPDPASRFQPQDVFGPSEVVSPAFGWRTAWRGRPWPKQCFWNSTSARSRPRARSSPQSTGSITWRRPA